MSSVFKAWGREAELSELEEGNKEKETLVDREAARQGTIWERAVSAAQPVYD